MKSRSKGCKVVAALLLLIGAGCGRRVHPPIVDSAVMVPDGAPGSVRLAVRAHDPDGDSIRLRVDWGDDSVTVTSYCSSPCSVDLNHRYSVDSPTVVVVSACDMNGGSIPIVSTVPVPPWGRVLWHWRNSGDGAMQTSALLANDGSDEVVMSECWEDCRFYAIKVADGISKAYAETWNAEYDFSGGPALCAATGRVIVGSDEGELYALTLGSLARAWRWPDIRIESLEPYIPFGAAAIRGAEFYVGRDNDTLYKFTDAGDSVTPGPRYGLHGATVVDAPVIDAAGNVVFGTDSGYLIKIDANLSSPIWRLHLIPVGDVCGPAIGSDGTIYCGTDSGRLYAVAPDGAMKWAATLDGVGARPVLGRSALFVGTDMGTAYSINPQTGGVIWQRSLAPYHSFATAPIVAANGCLYIVSDDDVLYCLQQDDGTSWWSCDCNRYLPGGGHDNSPRSRSTGLLGYDANPSITSEGNILVVGQNALFCVAGYPDGQLDPSAPWPKWQHDPYNTGYVGGGR